jgi:hypothetical protein
MAAYGEAIAQGGALGGTAMAHGGRETPDEARLL